jgi:hypothetical protein
MGISRFIVAKPSVLSPGLDVNLATSTIFTANCWFVSLCKHLFTTLYGPLKIQKDFYHTTFVYGPLKIQKRFYHTIWTPENTKRFYHTTFVYGPLKIQKIFTTLYGPLKIQKDFSSTILTACLVVCITNTTR